MAIGEQHHRPIASGGYINEAADLELLCTKGGDGSIALDGVLLKLKEAKALPSSD